MVASAWWSATMPTVKGGTYYPMTVKKHLRAQEIARENRLPCVYLVDSGGALPAAARMRCSPIGEHFGRIFYNQATLSAAGVPQIAVVLGSCTAGGAYVPAMCDESLIVRNQGTIFLGGPPLVQGRDRRSGLCRGARRRRCAHAALGRGRSSTRDNDEHALALARRIIADLPPPEPLRTRRGARTELCGRRALRHRARRSRASRSMCARSSRGSSMDSEFDELKPRYGKTLVRGFARVAGLAGGHHRQ